MTSISFAPPDEIARIKREVADRYLRAQAIADASRLNAVSMITFAGSGHIGSSMSAMDIVTWLWLEELQGAQPTAAGAGDRYYSSKGHDAPGLYALLIGLGMLDASNLTGLRRLQGLPGHPDIATPYMVTNTGSLGMGISKARGMAIANRLDKNDGRIFVLVGDGELQEGQFWESLQPTANGSFSEITVIVDCNGFQSDKRTSEVSDLGDIGEKVRSFGWAVERCDGHDFAAIEAALDRLSGAAGKPRLLVAETVKGRGVSFMEGTTVESGGLYRFHSGAPSEEAYAAAVAELTSRVNETLEAAGTETLTLAPIASDPRPPASNPERLISAYSDELRVLGGERPEIVVLDADLMVDTGTFPFAQEFPARFVEAGIAEQDMVSQAGALALKGKLPIVHSFACFLSTRANEQIYNNASERSKVIYHASLAGLLPAGPGHSHQSLRDISAVGSIPGLVLLQPANELETRLALRWSVEENSTSTWLRLCSLPVGTAFELPPGHSLQLGRGVSVQPGGDGLVFAYGPVMLNEAVGAAQLLGERGLNFGIINMPWLNRVDPEWLIATVRGVERLVVVEDHYADLGLASFIAPVLAKTGLRVRLTVLGVEGLPASGQNREVLEHHGLTAERLAERIEATA